MGFFKRRGEEKLYKQWSKYASLPPEAIPEKETPRDTPAPREKRESRSSPVLYILLVAAALILCVGVVLLLTQSC